MMIPGATMNKKGPAKGSGGGDPRQRGGILAFLAALLCSCGSMGHYEMDKPVSCQTSFTGRCGADISYYTVHRESYQMPMAVNEIAASRSHKTLYPKHKPLKMTED